MMKKRMKKRMKKKIKKGNNNTQKQENKNNQEKTTNKPKQQNQNKKDKKPPVVKTEEPEIEIEVKKVKKVENTSNKRAYQVSTLDKKMLKTVANKTKKEKKQWYESEEVQYAGIGVACFLVVMDVYTYIFSSTTST